MATVQESIPVTEERLSTVDDIEDQLNYLLNKTVRHNDTFRREYQGTFNTGGFSNSLWEQRSKTHIPSNDSVAKLDLPTLGKKYRELRDEYRTQNKHWWTFADVVPTWEENIERIFNGQVTQETNEALGNILLHEGARCIMGESWGGNGWGNCDDCHWLGGAGLNLFAGHASDMIDVNSRDGYMEYKMKYEYHWNKYHHDIGNTCSHAPTL